MSEEVIKIMKEMAIERHKRCDIMPCHNKTWDECLQIVKLDGEKKYMLYYNIGKATYTETLKYDYEKDKGK